MELFAKLVNGYSHFSQKRSIIDILLSQISTARFSVLFMPLTKSTYFNFFNCKFNISIDGFKIFNNSLNSIQADLFVEREEGLEIMERCSGKNQWLFWALFWTHPVQNLWWYHIYPVQCTHGIMPRLRVTGCLEDQIMGHSRDVHETSIKMFLNSTQKHVKLTFTGYSIIVNGSGTKFREQFMVQNII